MWDSLSDVKVGTVLKVKKGQKRNAFAIAESLTYKTLLAITVNRIRDESSAYPIVLKVTSENNTGCEYIDIALGELKEFFEPHTYYLIKNLGGDLYQ